MGSFGEKLRREREMRAITLEEIAEATKIGTRSLKALEDEQFDILPGGIFNKGFVRAYAKYLGISEEQAVTDYLNAIGEQPEKAEPQIEEIAAQAEAARNRKALQDLKEKGAGGAWLAFVLFVLLITGGGAGWRYYQLRLQEKASQAAAQAAAAQATAAQQTQQAAVPAQTDLNAIPAQNTNAPTTEPNALNTATQQTGTSATSAAPQTVAPAKVETAAKVPIELQIKVTKATWLSIKSDDNPAATETLKYAEQRVVQAQQKIVLTTGNALDVTCNGKPLGILGENNRRNVLRFTPECVVR